MLKRLDRWQRDQALHGYGEPLLVKALDKIPFWHNKLTKLISKTRHSIDNIRDLYYKLDQIDPMLKIGIRPHEHYATATAAYLLWFYCGKTTTAGDYEECPFCDYRAFVDV